MIKHQRFDCKAQRKAVLISLDPPFSSRLPLKTQGLSLLETTELGPGCQHWRQRLLRLLVEDSPNLKTSNKEEKHIFQVPLEFPLCLQSSYVTPGD